MDIQYSINVILVFVAIALCVMMFLWRHEAIKKGRQLRYATDALNKIGWFKQLDQDDVYRLKDKAKQTLEEIAKI